MAYPPDDKFPWWACLLVWLALAAFGWFAVVAAAYGVLVLIRQAKG